MRELDKDGLDGALEASSTITAAIPAPPLVLRPELISPLPESGPRRLSPAVMVGGVALAGFLIGAGLFALLRPGTPAVEPVVLATPKMVEAPAAAAAPKVAAPAGVPEGAALTSAPASPAGAPASPPGATLTGTPASPPGPALAGAPASGTASTAAGGAANLAGGAPPPGSAPAAAAKADPPKAAAPAKEAPKPSAPALLGKRWSVSFGWDSAAPDAAALARIVKEAPACGGELVVEGFTCDIGDSAYNMNLSRLRADAVSTALVSAGVPQARLKVEAHGEDTGSGARRASRRVEVRCEGSSNGR